MDVLRPLRWSKQASSSKEISEYAHASIRNSAGKTPNDVAFTTNPDKAVQVEFQAMRNLLLDATRQKRRLAPTSG